MSSFVLLIFYYWCQVCMLHKSAIKTIINFNTSTNLIKQGKGKPSHTSYGPPCILDSADKFLEKLLQRMLTAAIEAARELSERQYGFRPCRSTLGAIADVVECLDGPDLDATIRSALSLLPSMCGMLLTAYDGRISLNHYEKDFISLYNS